MDRENLRRRVMALLAYTEALLVVTRQRLVLANLGLVNCMWSKMCVYDAINRLGRDEYDSVAQETLVVCSHNYDPRYVSKKTGRGVRFSSYACKAIYSNAWREATQGRFLSVPTGWAMEELSPPNRRLAEAALASRGVPLRLLAELKVVPEESVAEDASALLAGVLERTPLTSQERKVLRLILKHGQMPAAAREMGLTKERVRQLRKGAVAKARKAVGL